MQTAIKTKEDSGNWSLEMETEHFGMDHVQAGALFFKKWNIPPSVIEIVANHHAPDNSLQYPAQTGVVRISSTLVHPRFLFGLPFDKLPDHFPHHLENTSHPDVVTEMTGRYEDYIKQADTIAGLMTDWL